MKIWILLICLITTFANANDWQNIKRVNPKYPVKAIKQKLEGCVTVQFFINKQGNTQFVEPIASSHQVFEGEAVKAVEQWQYQTEQPSSQAQRQKVMLEFRLNDSEQTTYDADDCRAELTHESHEINAFRQNRLSKPTFGNSHQEWVQNSFAYHGVLSIDESKFLAKALVNIFKQFPGSVDEKEQAFLSLMNGLDYFGTLQQAELVNKPIDMTTTVTEPVIDASSLPITPIYQVAKYWHVGDMRISLDESIYQIIEERKLAVEFTISKRGKVTLIDFCRKIDTPLKQALTQQINAWQLTRLATPKNNIRTIMLLPSPQNSASYIDCDATWHDVEMSKIAEMERNAVYR
ncbi:energy transducer TonB [Thalassotalea sp. 1_MG-2023]|uniref:energy transducer TonB n=1 Tax=Thalassotalea sp. 1_MG-2023 TaxID=3062680 RepID=UPI0026E2D026|nr:energy transducer TonB [Thalassotalea sp. 1_MG-2023]MDO6426995.1 energy transducer TonB [Thalassotalea sp. 1_MG-2023]